MAIRARPRERRRASFESVAGGTAAELDGMRQRPAWRRAIGRRSKVRGPWATAWQRAMGCRDCTTAGTGFYPPRTRPTSKAGKSMMSPFHSPSQTLRTAKLCSGFLVFAASAIGRRLKRWGQYWNPRRLSTIITPRAGNLVPLAKGPWSCIVPTAASLWSNCLSSSQQLPMKQTANSVRASSCECACVRRKDGRDAGDRGHRC